MMSKQILYIIILLILFLLDGITKRGVKEKLTRSTFFILILGFCALRYDTTTDYFNYVRIFTGVLTPLETVGSNNSEAGYLLLNKSFAFHKYGYLVLFAFCSFFCLYSLDVTYKRMNIYTWGWFFSIALLVVFIFNNQIRQSLVLACFIYSIPLIQSKRFYTFSLVMILASTVHFSALAGWLTYFVYRFFERCNIRSTTWFIILGISYTLLVTDFLFDYTVSLFNMIERYQHFSENILYNQKTRANSGLGILLYGLIGLALIFVKKKVSSKNVIFVNISILYFSLFLILNNVFVVQRVLYYMLIFVVIALAKIMQDKNIDVGLKIFFFVSVIALWGRQTYANDRPYSTIFSYKVELGEFYYRNWGTRQDQRKLEVMQYYDYKGGTSLKPFPH